jgi:nucleoid DNA-binding protein|tara:strand:- start:649 stop:948 length:300 start_codon:yes stop_codon:yes gene_type:complete
MEKIKRINITKKDLSNIIFSKIGLSKSYVNIITDDLINILIQKIKLGKLNITNFGVFNVINKSERIGRNPKSKENFIISSRSSITFKASKYLIKKINNI